MAMVDAVINLFSSRFFIMLPPLQVRTAVTLPRIMALHCGVYDNPVAKELWHQLNEYEGHWLPEKIRVYRDSGTGTMVVSPLIWVKLWSSAGIAVSY